MINDFARRPPDARRSIVDRIVARIGAAEQRVAIEQGTRRLTYGGLGVALRERAGELPGSIRPGELVAIERPRSVEYVVDFLAVFVLGGVPVPLDPSLPRHRREVALQGLPSARLLKGEGDIADGAYVFFTSGSTGHQATNLDLPIDPASAVYVLFTSGSTGRPKGVVVEHRNLANFLSGMLPRMALPEHLNFANVTTFAADLGLTNVYGALTTGGTLHVIPYELATDPELLAGYFRDNPIDVMKSVPSHLQAMKEAGVLDSIVPSRYLVLAGEAFPWDLAESVRAVRPQCEIWNHYGPTETTIDVLAYKVPDGQSDRCAATVPIGSPIDRVRAHIVDRRLRPVPVGTAGELLISGDSVARGYLAGGQPGAAFVPDPFSASQRPARTVPATGSGCSRTAGWSSSAGWIGRRRYVDTGSSRAMSRRRCGAIPPSPTPPWPYGRTRRDAPPWWPTTYPTVNRRGRDRRGSSRSTPVRSCRRTWCPVPSCPWIGCRSHRTGSSTGGPCRNPTWTPAATARPCPRAMRWTRGSSRSGRRRSARRTSGSTMTSSIWAATR